MEQKINELKKIEKKILYFRLLVIPFGILAFILISNKLYLFTNLLTVLIFVLLFTVGIPLQKRKIKLRKEIASE